MNIRITKTGALTAGNRLLAVLVCCFLVFSGAVCKVTSKEGQERSRPVTIRWWSVFGDYGSVAPLVAQYRQIHPNVSVEFRRLAFDEYETAILDALAEDRGPDIISLHNTWLREWQDRLLPAPASVRMAFKEITGSIKKETIITVRDIPIINASQVRNNYIDVVGNDVILPMHQSDPRLPPIDRVYGLPMSVDTMVMFYNRDLLDAAGIAQPAQYWGEFQKQVKLLTQLDETGQLIQSAAAMGTSNNVDRPSDMLSVLMLQNGTPMTDSSGSATFDRYTPETVGQPMPPGAVALIFYNDFANPLKEVYTWNADQPNALEAFAKGKLAYMFGYSYHLDYLKNQAAGLNFSTSPFPQIEGNKPVNYANYWVETVLAKSKVPNESWDFLNFISNAERAKTFINASGLPTAHRQLVNAQLEDPDLSVFASQLPSTQSWYRGKDGQAAEEVMVEMIDQMTESDADPQRILEIGAVKINQTIK